MSAGDSQLCSRLRHFHADFFTQPEHRFPEIVVIRHNDPSPGGADSMQPGERSLDILQVSDHIGQNNDVEPFAQLQRFRIADMKLQRGVLPGCLADHRLTQIHSDSSRRLEGRQ
jgi:hypothetical protein